MAAAHTWSLASIGRVVSELEPSNRGTPSINRESVFVAILQGPPVSQPTELDNVKNLRALFSAGTLNRPRSCRQTPGFLGLHRSPRLESLIVQSNDTGARLPSTNNARAAIEQAETLRIRPRRYWSVVEADTFAAIVCLAINLIFGSSNPAAIFILNKHKPAQPQGALH